HCPFQLRIAKVQTDDYKRNRRTFAVRRLEAFAAFSSDLDAASAAALGRGERLAETAGWSQYAPVAVRTRSRLDLAGHLRQAGLGAGRRHLRFESGSVTTPAGTRRWPLTEISDTGQLLRRRRPGASTKGRGRFKRNEFTAADGSSMVERRSRAGQEDREKGHGQQVRSQEPGW
ncbi:hypothetical protein HBB16_15750, partial [Pseudonocardia sp. MCCB 268]|nr:hypothetical protein [Pseudonocardia cytotoxica]